MKDQDFSMTRLMKKLKKECEYLEKEAAFKDLDLNEILAVETKTVRTTKLNKGGK